MYSIATVKVTSEPTAENLLGFIVINLADFNPEVHEPFDEESHEALSGAVKSGQIVPSTNELLAARDALQARERELNERAAALADQAAANEAEAQRLATEKATAEKAAKKAAEKPAPDADKK